MVDVVVCDNTGYIRSNQRVVRVIRAVGVIVYVTNTYVYICI